MLYSRPSNVNETVASDQPGDINIIVTSTLFSASGKLMAIDWQ